MKKGTTSCYWFAIFGSSTKRRWKLMTCLEFWGSSESETSAFCTKIHILKFGITWPDLDLASVKNWLRWSHRVEWPSLSICKKACACRRISTKKACVARHVCLTDLDLYLFKYDLRAHAVLFSDIYQCLRWV